MVNIEEFIDGSKFESIADYGFGDKYTYERPLDLNSLSNFISSFDKNRKPIIYVDSDRVLEFFKLLQNTNCGEFILLSHNGDTIFYEQEVAQKPNCIVKWYGQNINVPNTEVLVSLPIGLERPHWSLSRYGENGHKHKKINEFVSLNFEKNILCYLNFSIETNRAKREWVINHFRTEDWCSIRLAGINGSLDTYFTECKQSHFVMCPDGNGIDCHRNWEMLYLGVTPIIEKSHFHNEIYSDLPVLIVDSFKDITHNFLIRNINKQNQNYNFEKYKFSFWKNKIENSI